MVLQQIRPAIVITLLLTLITGLLYPLAVTTVAQGLFENRADGSFIMRDGAVVGSKFLGQAYTLADPAKPGGTIADPIDPSTTIVDPANAPGTLPDPKYFQSRVSAAGAVPSNPDGYDPMSSGASNLGPTNAALTDRVMASIEQIAQLEGVEPGQIPADAVYASGSGLDPDISPAYAAIQVARIASERGISESDVRALVAKHTAGRQLGVLGERRVNVLQLNLALDGK